MREDTLTPRVIADATERLVGQWYGSKEPDFVEVIKLLLEDYIKVYNTPYGDTMNSDFSTIEKIIKAIQEEKNELKEEK